MEVKDFKVGDRVIFNKNSTYHGFIPDEGTVGVITDITSVCDDDHPYYVCWDGSVNGWWYKQDNLHSVIFTNCYEAPVAEKYTPAYDVMVSHPSHYQSETGLEAIDVIEAFTFDLKGIEAFDTGNILKYMCRWKQKDGLRDLKKAQWYLNHLIEHVEKLQKEND